MFFYTFLPKLLNMSLTASVAILAVLLLRQVLKRAPKMLSYALWSIVLFRLLCPISVGACFSLFELMDSPITEMGRNTSSMAYIPADIVHVEDPAVDLPGISSAINTAVPNGGEQLAADPLETPLVIGTYIWMAGVLAMAGYAVYSYGKLCRKLHTASPMGKNIYLADGIPSPFVMGLIRPRIYLPSDLNQYEQAYILLHEKHHIRRLDHIIKALAFLALSIHWFNPLVWMAFHFAGKDMEMSCDEVVIQKMGSGIRADYAASLLRQATGKPIIAVTPLAFGGGNTRDRIHNLAHWKKPSPQVILPAGTACLILAAVLLTNPMGSQKLVMGINYDVEEILYDYRLMEELYPDPPDHYFITTDGQVYVQNLEGENWVHTGSLSPCALTNEELYAYKLANDPVRRDEISLPDICDAYIIRYENQDFSFVFQTEDGKTYLANCRNAVSQREQPGSDAFGLHKLYQLKSSIY